MSRILKYAKFLFLGSSGLFAADLLILIICLYTAPNPGLAEGISYGKLALDHAGKSIKISLSKDEKYRLPVKLEDISPLAINAAIKYEDKYFYYHPGVNPLALFRSFFSIITSGRKFGASTITMQTARLLHVPVTSTFKGKLKQIWIALLLEIHYSKQDILEAYFNLAPYGGNIEGIEAASRIYFHKSAHDLTAFEALVLATVPQNPVSRNPVKGSENNAAWKRLAGMLEFSIPQGSRLNIYSPAEQPAIASHLASELLGGENSSCIFRTWINRDLQLMLEKRLKVFAERGRRYGLNNAAAILVHTPTMQVHALAGSSDFFDNSISGQIDGTKIRRSPGSTLKPFIYGLAIDQGLIHPASILPDSPRSYGGYDPENFDRGFAGPLNASDALKASRNLPAIFLSGQLEQPGLYGFLRQADINFPHDAEFYGLALTLGGAEISMREMASLYAMLANQGFWQPLRFLKDDQHYQSKRLLSREAAWLALWMLEREEARIGALPVRYKTGTSNGFRDAWTAGVTGEYVVVAWAGNFDNSSNQYLVGAETALPLFMEICKGLASMRKLRDAHPGQAEGLNLHKVKVCASTGDFELERCTEHRETIIIPGVSPIRDTGILRKVLIDKSTGLRACVANEDQTEEKWLEFWPTDMREHFERAGIYKPEVPEFLPQCRQARIAASGKNPRIILPKKNVSYKRRASSGNFELPLLAASDPDVKMLYWYANNQYIGSAKPGEILIWKTESSGKIALRVVDEKGWNSSQECTITYIP